MTSGTIDFPDQPEYRRAVSDRVWMDGRILTSLAYTIAHTVSQKAAVWDTTELSTRSIAQLELLIMGSHHE
jgi:hypothetical protein